METKNIEKQNDDQYVFFTNEDSDKYDIEIGYVLIRCKKCYASWGATPINGKISKRSFICRSCAKELVFQQMQKCNESK